MPSSIVSRKRKADALEADGSVPDSKRKSAPDDDSPAHLPATCLAAMLNFMWYTDVRQCMLAGKMMAVEAARHIETLNITKASELDAPSARRFQNASEVNVLCLISEVDDEEDEDDEDNLQDQISLETVTRVVPFLASIPNLERVYVGGVYLDRSVVGTEVWERYWYETENCEAPREHQTIFKTLVQVIIGGFQTRSLPQGLELDGILESGQLECAASGAREDPDNPCQFCRHVLSSFPLHLLMKPMTLRWAFCVSHVDCIRTFLRRDGAEAVLRSNDGTKMLLACLRAVIPNFLLYSETEVDEAFLKKMTDQGARIFSYMYPSPRATNQSMRPVISINWSRDVSGNKSLKAFLDLVKSSSLLQDVIKDIPRSRSTLVFGEYKGKEIFVRQTFDSFLEVGLQLNTSDYIIVDPEKEPALLER